MLDAGSRTHEAGDEAVLTDANRLNLTLVEVQAVDETKPGRPSSMPSPRCRAFKEKLLTTSSSPTCSSCRT